MSSTDNSGALRMSALCGILFAITFAAGGILLGDLFGSFADSDETFVEYFESSSNRNASAFGGVLVFVSGVALLPFVRGLVRLVAPGEDSLTAELGLPLSYVASGLIISSAAALSTVGLARVFADITGEDPIPFQGSSIAVLPQLGYVLMVFAAWTMAVVLAIVGSAFLRSQTLPRGIGWVTIVCTVLLVLAPTGAALFAMPVWGLPTAIFMLRRAATARA